MNFDQVYKNLNKTQKLVADTHEGASLVIAGPGSGKTAVVGTRIGKMLKAEQMINPNMILAITFTNAGAVAIRKRLIEYIGVEAYGVHIFTFHSFCNDIVMGNLDYFGVRQLEPVTELETLEILYEIIDELSFSNPLSRVRGDIYFEVGRLKILFGLMKEELWTVDYIIKQSKIYLDSLETDDFYKYKRSNKKNKINVGDIKWHLIKAEKEKITKLIAGAELIFRYNEKLAQRQRYDFSDMIHWVISAFKDNENFLQGYQERFQYVLVDEFQDTNGSQMELLHLLISFWDNPNIFVVCDEAQCIFEFQGARIKNIMDFKKIYDPETHVLNINYRSTQMILDGAKNVIENNLSSLVNQIPGLTKDLKAGNLALEQITPSVIECSTLFDEESMIVERVLKLKESGVDPTEIAILYRKHKQADNIIKEFHVLGVPVNVKRRVNVLHQPIIQQLLTLLTYMMAELELPGCEDQLLFKALHYEYFNIPRKDIERFILSSRSKASATPTENIKETIDKINKLIAEYNNMSLASFLEATINDLGILNYILAHDNKLQLMVCLTTFFNFAKSELYKNPLMTGSELLKKIEKMIKNKISLPVMDINYNEEGIICSTIHGVKGLEFQHVFMLGCNRDQWEKSRGGINTYKIPNTITHSTVEDKLEGNRRLFYVAMTRAKEGLTISYAAKDNDGNPLERSQFIDESGISIHYFQNKRGEDTLKNSLKPEPFAPALEGEYIDRILENYRLSVSHVNKYLRCQVAYYYENILYVPFVASEALIFGNAIHVALKRFYDEYKEGKLHKLDWLSNEFSLEMLYHRGQITEDAYNRRLELGHRALGRYYKDLLPLSTKITLNEVSFNNIIIDGIPVKYVFDKIEYRGNYVTIKDYKTGKVNYIKKSMKPPGKGMELGGDYWRQLVMGKLVIDKMSNFKEWIFEAAAVEVICDKDMMLLPLEFNAFDEGIVLEQLHTAYDGIIGKKFDQGCGECSWCLFQETLKV